MGRTSALACPSGRLARCIKPCERRAGQYTGCVLLNQLLGLGLRWAFGRQAACKTAYTNNSSLVQAARDYLVSIARLDLESDLLAIDLNDAGGANNGCAGWRGSQVPNLNFHSYRPLFWF